MRQLYFLFVSLVFLVVFSFTKTAKATNPPMSNFMINLSEGETEYGFEDRAPEMIIDGNTIHTLWLQRTSTWDEFNSYVYYRRSTDLGETWENPIQLYQIIDEGNMIAQDLKRMAVDNGVVHIAFPDYDYDDNGTGKLLYFRSTNNGAGFEPVVELVNTGGGYNWIGESYIQAAGGKVVVAYQGEGGQNGTRVQVSIDGGNSFAETLISEEGNAVKDLWFDGNQIVVLFHYTYYFYGLNVGKVWVSVSNDNGNSFTTSKISIIDDDETERCLVNHDYHYVPKIAKSGSNIHVVFQGYKDDNWTILYARSNNNGASFEPAVDINNGVVGGTNIQGQPTVVAKGNYVYMAYVATNADVFLVRSANGGSTLSEPQFLLTEDIHYIKDAWFPFLYFDPNEATGATVYFGDRTTMLRKSTDGGESFSGTFYAAPLLNLDLYYSQMKIDQNGNFHWLCSGQMDEGYPDHDYDIFYRKIADQPEAGDVNKCLQIQEEYNGTNELVIVPSSETMQFTGNITGEAWIKVSPDCAGNFNVFAKVNGYDGSDYSPSGFNIGFRKDGESFVLNSGLATDMGQFVNWTNGVINDNLWHHIAFTYDAGAVPNNFITYLDGLPVAEQTVTGDVLGGDGLFMIGSRNGLGYSADFKVDEIRLWNRTLTQEELLANQHTPFTGEESGLQLYLNFDDTFKDISGNGNDAIPLYLGILEESNFNPPLADFETYVAGNQAVFNNTSQNASSYSWNFGDDNTSNQGFPTNIYATPGEYHVSLTAKNDNSAASAIGQVTILGLDRVEPTESGNTGYTTINVYGGGLTTENTTIKLRKTGLEDIEGGLYNQPSEGVISGVFDLQEVATGLWDVVVTQNGVESVLPGAFQIKAGEAADPWVHVLGRGQILHNWWATYTVEYGNNGNIDAWGVPLWLVFSDDPGFDIEFIDVDIDLPLAAVEAGLDATADSIPLYFTVADYFGVGKDARVYVFYIPSIPANSSQSVHIRLKTDGDLEIESWVSDPYFSGDIEETPLMGFDFRDGDPPFSEMNQDARLCIGASMAKVLAEGLAGLAWSALPVGCISAAVSNFWNPFDYKPKSAANKVPTWGSAAWSITSLVVGCAGDLPYFKAWKLTKATLALGASMYDAYQADRACRDAWAKKSKSKRTIGAVSSFDPNEMVGPDGYGEDNYIKRNNVMPYTVLFENKSDATAPAHYVQVLDTLDLTKFDIADFGFSSFGFGDTIISLPGNKLKEFSVDIDLQPEKPLVVRYAASLDTLTGIISFEFHSLTPSTLLPEEDPATGFLPPNVSSPEGEGFVSYHVGLKAGLQTGDELHNQAHITFDGNPPIVTNDYLNVLDIDPPESHVLSLENETTITDFTVSWTGSDAGSGIANYSIWVLVNDTLLVPWVTDTTVTSAEFHGEVGYNYKFYSVAVDNVNWIEETPGTYDAEINVVVGMDEHQRDNANLMVFPNPAKGKLHLKLKTAAQSTYRVEMLDLNGRCFYKKTLSRMALENGVDIGLTRCQVGAYVLKVVSDDGTFVRKVIVR